MKALGWMALLTVLAAGCAHHPLLSRGASGGDARARSAAADPNLEFPQALPASRFS